MFLVPAEEKDVLVTIATRGYSENGAGAEVRFGEGICGMVAEARKPIRISGLMRGMLYALAMHRAGAASRACRAPHSAAGPAQSRESARRAAARARRARRRPLRRERGAVSLPRGGPRLDRAARQLPRHRRAEHGAAGAERRGHRRHRRTAALLAPAPAGRLCQRRGRAPGAGAKSCTTPPTSASWSTATT